MAPVGSGGREGDSTVYCAQTRSGPVKSMPPHSSESIDMPAPTAETSLAVHPYQRLVPESVLDALEALGIAVDARILTLNSYENRVYQVGVEEDSPVIVKFYRPQRWNRAQILEEHAFTLELAELELPVVPPLRLDGSNTLYQHDGFDFAVFE